MAAGTLPDLPDQQTPSMPPIQGAPPAAAASPSQPAAPGAGATPPLGQPAQGGIAQGTGQAKGEVPTPEVQLKFKPDKLAKANTTLEVLNAATAQSRKDYMDWWQKQHGDIDEKYDHLKAQIGARPSDDEPQSKKEKFAALLEFGLHLMKASSGASTNQGAVLTGTLSDEHEAMTKAHQGKVQAEQGAYDTQANAIENARAKEQAGIGTPAAAMKASSDEARTSAQTTQAQTSSLKNLADAGSTKASTLGAPTYAAGPDGTIHAIVRDDDGKAHAEPVTGIDGKPFKGRVLGRTTGSGIDKSGQDPAAVRTYKYATQVMGMDKNVAAPILGVKPSGNAIKDHTAVYKAVLSTTMGDEKAARRVADQYTLDNYGAGAVAKANAPPIANAPPPQALQGLKPGMVRDFGGNGKWTVGIDGKPRQIGAGPQTIQ